MSSSIPEEFVDPLLLDARRLTRSAISSVRALLGVLGIVGVVLGIALLVWPGKTLQVAAIVLGIYFIVDAIVRVGVAIQARSLSGGWRVLNVFVAIIYLFGGVFMLRNSALAGGTLLIVITFFVGAAWISEGILALMESGLAASQGWAIFSGIISVLAGISVLVVPRWSAVYLMIFTGVALVVLGVIALGRAFTFGKDALAATK